MTRITKEELLEKIFNDDYEHLKGKKLRMTRVRVPGKEVCLAHRIHYVTGVSRQFSARWHMFIFRQPSQGHILRCIHTGLIFNCHS